MKKKNFLSSNVIIELTSNYESQAKELVAKLNPEGENGLIAIDCSPNGSLNPFYYENGLESAAIIKETAGYFLGADLAWLEKIIKTSKEFSFRTNFSIGEKAGLWERVRYDNYQEKLDWGQRFCVKNCRNQTRAWYPYESVHSRQELFSTKKEIIQFINENIAYKQKFYQPLFVDGPFSSWRMHYRLVFHVDNGETNFVGGLWLSRRLSHSEFKIFLAKDTTVGLIAPGRA